MPAILGRKINSFGMSQPKGDILVYPDIHLTVSDHL